MEVLPAAHHKQRFLEDNNDEIKEIPPSEKSINIGDFQHIDEVDNELWLVQCPKSVDISNLVSQKIKLPGRTSFNDLEAIAVEQITETAEKHAFGYANRKGKYSLRLLPVRGNIVLRHRLKANEPITAENVEELCATTAQSTRRVEMPKKIKIRHPLLGAQFEAKVTLSKRVSARLKQASEQSSIATQEARLAAFINRKQNGHATTEACNDSLKIEQDSDLEFLGETIVLPKKKKTSKRKKSVTASVEEGQEASPRKKRKHKSINGVETNLESLILV